MDAEYHENSPGGSARMCCFCGDEDSKLVSLFSDEALEIDIPTLIEMYLPIRFSEYDVSALNCCRKCISTIVTWHSFVEKAVATTQLIPKENMDSNPLEDGKSIKFEDVETNDQNYTPAIQTLILKTQSDVNEIIYVYQDDEERFDETIKQENHDERESAEENSDNQEQNGSSTRKRRRKADIQPSHFCTLCDKSFTRVYDLQRHITDKHATSDEAKNIKKNQLNLKELKAKCAVYENDERFYKCDICEQKMKMFCELKKHRSLHTGVKAYVCHFCGAAFRLQSTLHKHVKLIHDLVRDYGCEVCGKRFGLKAARDEHMNIHTDTRPYTCDVCNKSFRQKSSLHVHKLFHSSFRKYECSTCKRRFRRPHELKVHHRIHTGARPYSCEVCGARFRVAQDMKRHKKIHSRSNAKQTWKCDVCKLCFSQRKYLKAHQKCHTVKIEDSE